MIRSRPLLLGAYSTVIQRSLGYNHQMIRYYSVRKPETPVETALREAKDMPNITSAPLVAEKKPLSVRIKEELLHYWHGLRLLGAETRISSRLLVKLLKGNQLGRREVRQLQRSTSDLLRLVPFLVILIIPFLEFALPLLLRLFPNMLPSTFESKFQEQEKKRKLLKMRLEMAKFLQSTIGELALSGTSATRAQAKEFNDFFNSLRISGEPAPTNDILRIARNFGDELTLANLSRPQLVSMAKYMNLGAFGTDTFLRHQIDKRLKEIYKDDQMISSEGIDSLDLNELQQACLFRGIPTVSPARMRYELGQWLDLHLIHKISSSLLVLSHAFQTAERLPSSSNQALKSKAEALQATLTALPHQVISEAQLLVSEKEGVATYKQKLDVLKEQEELIADELEQDAAQEASKKLKDAENDKSTEGIYVSVDDVISKHAPPELSKEMLDIVRGQSGTLSEKQLKNLAEVLKTITKDSALSDIKAFVEDLKEDRAELKEDIEELKIVTKTEPPKATERLGSQVDKMISKIEEELAKYDTEIGSKLNLVNPNNKGEISISDLEDALKVIRDRPNDERIQAIIQHLDKDNDGIVAINEIIALAEEKELESLGNVVKPPNDRKLSV